MKRLSVIYLLNGRYHHVASDTPTEAKALLEKLSTDQRRKPVGIYDAKTELFDWEPDQQQAYDQASISEQAQRSNYITSIAQALRRRDASWQPTADYRKPSLFA